jgi:hypothetical protein
VIIAAGNLTVQSPCDRFQDRIEPVRDAIPEEAMKVIDEELLKLAGLEQASMEFNGSRNYLDWLTSMPWGKYSEEKLDVPHAKAVKYYPSHSLLTWVPCCYLRAFFSFIQQIMFTVGLMTPSEGWTIGFSLARRIRARP